MCPLVARLLDDLGATLEVSSGAKDFASSCQHYGAQFVDFGDFVERPDQFVIEADLVALARSKPGTLSFSSAGNGTSSHLSGELFKAVAKVDLLHISYKGTAASLPDLMAGRVQMTFDTASNFVDILQTGKLQPLAVTSRKRLAHMPGVPSMSETQAFSEYEVSLWLGVLAPAGTSPGIVRYLNRQLAAVMQHPGMLASLRPLGIEPLHGSPEDFARAIDQDRRKWAAVIKAADIQAD
eukprot:gene98-102_t